MDILLSIVALFGAVTNVLGVDDIVRATLAEIRDRSGAAYIRFRVWLAARIAGPLAWFMWACAAGMLGIFALASYIHFNFEVERVRLEDGKSVVGYLRFGDGQYPLFTVTTFVCVAGIVGWAFYQRRVGQRFLLDADGLPLEQPVVQPLPPGHHGPVQQTDETEQVPNPNFRPRRVSFFVSGILLTVGMVAESLTLGFHALAIGSQGLWLTAMLTRYLGIVVIATVTAVLAWLVRRGGGFFERALQLAFETIAPIVPGITFANVRQRLFPNGLNLLEEEADARKIAAIAMGLFVIVAPYDLIVLIHPRNWVAVYVIFPYAATVIAGLMAFRRPSLRARVSAASDRFYWLCFRLIPIALLVIGAWSLFTTKTDLGHNVKAQSEKGYDKVTKLVATSDASSAPKGVEVVKSVMPQVAVQPTPPSPATVTIKVQPQRPVAARPPVRAVQTISDDEVDARLNELVARRGLRVPND